MKKALSYTLLLLFVFNLLAYYPFYLMRKGEIRNEMKQFVKSEKYKNQLSIFTLNQKAYSELEWEDEGKEFKYLHNMYDIVLKEIDSEKNITIHCIQDKQEAELFAFLDKQSQENSSSTSTKHGAKRFFKIHSFVYLPFANIFHPVLTQLAENTFNYFYNLPSLSIATPFIPPRFS